MYPCQGLRVLDMSRVVAGPIAGRILSDLGADVVKLEPPEGDVTRVWGQMRHGLSGFYTQQNAGKRNLCVDLRVDGAADIVKALAAQADVVIETSEPASSTGWASATTGCAPSTTTSSCCRSPASGAAGPSLTAPLTRR